MTPGPEAVPSLAERLGMDESAVATKVEAMAKNELLLRIKMGESVLYMPSQFAPGMWEWQMNRMDREFSELVHEYFPALVRPWSNIGTQPLRVVPLNVAIEAKTQVESYDKIRDLVKDKEMISLAPCVCTKDKELLGEPCKYPTERCINFDFIAQYYIDNDLGRQISQKELMEVLAMGEKEGLVLSIGNAKDMNFICLCCGCCCIHLRSLRIGGHPARQVQSSFSAAIDSAQCTSCGTCQERCQMEAIITGGDAYKIDYARCIGCGVCVPNCPAEAISLRAKSDVKPISDSLQETFMKISAERGLA